MSAFEPGAVQPVASPGTDLRIVSTVDFDDPTNRIAFASYAHEQGLRERRKREPTWLTIISYYLAKQWVEYNDQTRRLVEPPTSEARVRYTENLFAPYVRNAIAQLLQNDPSIQLRPATADPEDWGVAKLASKVARAWWDAKALKQETEMILLWGKLTGNGFLKVYWDEYAGEFLAEDDPEIVGENPDGSAESLGMGGGANGDGALPLGRGNRMADFFMDVAKMIGKESETRQQIAQASDGRRFIRMGDVAFEPVNPFCLVMDPAGDSLRTCRWVDDARLRTLDWIRGRYPKTGQKVSEESARSKDGRNLGDHVKNLLRGGEQMADVPRAVVHEVYIAPSPDKPEGLTFSVAGGVALDEPRSLPTRLNGKPVIPYFQYRDKIVPGDPWAAAILEDGIAPQTLRNRAISQMMESANLTGSPVLLNPVNSGMKKGQMSNTPGAIWNYTPGNEPKYLEPPSLPGYVQEMPNILRQGFENTVGLHEVSQGRAPSNTRTGVALAFLAEKDQMSAGITAEELRVMWSQAMGCALELYADRVPDEPRLAKITGRGGDDLDIFEFTGRDLRGKQVRLPGTNAFDCVVDFLPGLPKSKQAMQEQVFRAIEAGLINLQDPEERRLAWKWSGFAFPDDGDVRRENEAQQHVEVREMLGQDDMQAQTVAQTIHPWDVHVAHLDVLDRFLKRPEVLKMPPELLALLLQHRTMHEMAMAAQMSALSPAPPAPGGAQPPPGPVGGTLFSPPPGPPGQEFPQTPQPPDSMRAGGM